MKKSFCFLFVIVMLFFSCSDGESPLSVDESHPSECEQSASSSFQGFNEASSVNYTENPYTSITIVQDDVYVNVDLDGPQAFYPGSTNVLMFTYHANGTTSSRRAVLSPLGGLVFLPDWTCTGDYPRWGSFWDCGSRKMSNMTDDLQGKIFAGMFPGPVLAITGLVCLLEEFGVTLPEGQGLVYFDGLTNSGLDFLSAYEVMIDSGLATSEELLEDILVDLERDSILFGGYLSPREYYHELKYEYGMSDLEIIQEFKELHVI